MSEQRYADDKPRDCKYCYFWNDKSECCRRRTCFYLIKEEEVAYTEGDCRVCPYGMASKCIGYCTVKLLKEMRERREQGAGGSR